MKSMSHVKEINEVQTFGCYIYTVKKGQND